MHPIPTKFNYQFILYFFKFNFTILGSEKSGNCVKAKPTIVNIIDIKTTKPSTSQWCRTSKRE